MAETAYFRAAECSNLRKQTAAELSYSRYKNEHLAREHGIVDYRTSCDMRHVCGRITRTYNAFIPNTLSFTD